MNYAEMSDEAKVMDIEDAEFERIEDEEYTDASSSVGSVEEQTEPGAASDATETSDAAQTSDAAEKSDAAETSDDAEGPADKKAARKARHNERVARLSARFASLVARGEAVIASFDKKADDADARFASRSKDVEARLDDFATRVEERMAEIGEQLASDIETMAQSVDERNDTNEGEVAKEAEAANGSEPAQADDKTEADKSEAPYRAQFTPAAQAFRERMRVGTDSDLLLTDPEFVERFANFAFDDVPADVDLSDRTRFMCWLATLLGCQGLDEYRMLLPAALNVGLDPVAVKEIVYQAAAYLGIGRVYPFLKATNDVLAAAGVELPLRPQATTLHTEQSRYEGGEEAQVACFGEQIRGYKDRGAADYPHVNRWLVKNCFGDWYTRGGLTIAERELCTFCYIAAQGGCEPQLKAHVAANVHCGNDRAFLIKVVSNNVPFIGYPRSLNAMAVVEEATGAKA